MADTNDFTLNLCCACVLFVVAVGKSQWLHHCAGCMWFKDKIIRQRNDMMAQKLSLMYATA